MRRSNASIALATAGLAAAAAWWRRHPSAMPYWQRAFVELPRPLITRAGLREALGVIPGSRVLEVGPGTGYYSLAVAEWLGPSGHLELLDLQPEMLTHIATRVRPLGLDARIGYTQADARAVPFDDGSFDAAFLVMALGEIADQDAAVRELARVVRPGGRVVVGELALDPHVVLPAALTRRAQNAGLRVERRIGPWFASYTVLTRADGSFNS